MTEIVKVLGETYWSEAYEQEMREENGLPPIPPSLGWWEPDWLYNLRMNICDGRAARAAAVKRWVR